MKPLHFAGLMVAVFAVYVLSSGLILRATPPYNAKFAPLWPSSTRLVTIIYAPVLWTEHHAPSTIGTPLRAYLEWCGCTFPRPANSKRRISK